MTPSLGASGCLLGPTDFGSGLFPYCSGNQANPGPFILILTDFKLTNNPCR
jgi:hypothetical protein